MEEKNIDREVLMSVYKNAHIGLQSISNVIDETDDERMKTELKNEYEGYEKLIGKLSSYMKENGVEPKDVNFMKKVKKRRL